MKQVTTVFICWAISIVLYSQTWTRCSNGLPDSVFHAFYKTSNICFAGGKKTGMYKSVDATANWLPMSSPAPMRSSTMNDIERADTFVFAGMLGGGVYRCGLHDTGWVQMNTGLANTMVWDLMVINDTLYAATFNKIYFTTNLGVSWQPFPNTGMNINWVYSLSYNSQYIFAGTAENISSDTIGVVFRIPRSGGIWERIDNGMPLNGVHLESAFSLDASDAYVLSGHDDVGLQRTSDNGDNWNQVIVNPGDVWAIKICGGGMAEIGTTFGGTWVTVDSGYTWVQDIAGFSYGATTCPAWVDNLFLDDSTLYAASDLGIFKKYVTPLSSPSTAGLEEQTIEDEIILYPNPVHEQVTCEIKSGTVIEQLYITNLTGQLQSNVCFQTLSPNRVMVDVTYFPPGIYLVYLNGKPKKMIKY